MGKIKELDPQLNDDILEFANINFIWHNGDLYVQDKHTKHIIYDICDQDAVKCINDLIHMMLKMQKEKNNALTIIYDRKIQLEEDYQKSVKAGMPTGGIIGEIDLLEDILEELGEKNDQNL